MKRLLVAILTLSACGPVTEQPGTVEPTADPVPTQAPPATPAPSPPVTGVPLAHVVLVAAHDVLVVREGPGVDHPIVASLDPLARDVPLGRESTPVGEAIWVVIDSPAGWVNAHYLSETGPIAFSEDPLPLQLLEQFAAIARQRGDLGPVASRRGLYVSHLDEPRRFPEERLAELLRDQTPYEWGSLGCSPEECPNMTFTEAVADSFLDAFDDQDVVVGANEYLARGNGLLPEAAVPPEFRNFNYLAVHDPGDDAEFDGLDWITWNVYFDYEDGQAVIVALSKNEWGP